MKYLVSIDGSDHAKTAVEYIKAVADASRDELVMLAVVEPQAVAFSFVPTTAMLDYDDAARTSAKQFLKVEVDAAREAGFTVEGYVATGMPKEIIVDRATAYGCDCVVVGARGLGAVKRFFLGSCSSYVLTHAPVSVMVVKGERPGEPRGDGEPRTFLWGYDGSDLSKYAFEFLGRVASPGDSVVALYSQEALVPAFVMADATIMSAIVAEEEKERVRQTEFLEQHHAANCEGLGLEAKTVVRSGDAVTAICDTAEEFDVDILVVGTRGLSTMERVLLGSVSKAAMHDAKVDAVLAVRPPALVPETSTTATSETSDTPGAGMADAGAPDTSTDS